MAWLIAIICIILVVVFWRVFAPIIALAVVGAVLLGIVLYFNSESNKREYERKQQAERESVARERESTRAKLAQGNAKAAVVQRQWEIRTEKDPASGASVPRTATVISDNSLCALSVEQRLDGTKLTGIYCDDLNILVDKYDGEIELKFDNRATSDKMPLEVFSDSRSAYIPSSPVGSMRNALPYGEFLRRMTEAKKVALSLHVAGIGQEWFVFSLDGCALALASIGAIEVWPRQPAQTATPSRPVAALRPATASPATAPTPPLGAPATQPPTQTARAAPQLPANAVLNVYGNDWVCARGYRHAGNECARVEMPQNAVLDVYGHDWTCVRGFRRIGNDCSKVELPQNAMLNVYGNDWTCVRGYRRAGNECAWVEMPQNAVLNVYGNDWVCARGFRRIGNECSKVELPQNAMLNVYGNDWTCSRGYRRSGDECLLVGVPSR